ncbi:hypothetical protein [Streptomyces beigongshangae]|nr:hypothetical protein [Streptomyces sp. REN17]
MLEVLDDLDVLSRPHLDLSAWQLSRNTDLPVGGVGNVMTRDRREVGN